MAKFYDALNDSHVAFIKAQKVFFVATAPLCDAGHVNPSRKGYDSFRVIGPNRVAYADLGGSGAETLAQFGAGHERARDIIFADITAVQDSCGWAVPFMEYRGEQDQLRRYIDHMALDDWHESRLTKNAQSIDGLPALRRPEVAE
jgi:hypothetical protein